MNRFALVACCAGLLLAPARGQSDDPEQRNRRIKRAILQGQEYLIKQRDARTGGWGSPGVTAMVLRALRNSQAGHDEKFLREPIQSLIGLKPSEIRAHRHATYVVATRLMALVDARERVEDADLRAGVDGAIKRSRAFLVEQQADEGERRPPADPRHGGLGYGGDRRPDLHNTQLALEALRRAGLPPGSPFYRKAAVFVERCQNRRESNDQRWAGNDGGFIYYPGTSHAGSHVRRDGSTGPRSYGSMTCIGLLALLQAGKELDDPRVAAAFRWIQTHYTVKENPGLGKRGLFGYWFALSHALTAYRVDQVVDARGGKHDWRGELAREVLSLQARDGSWRNTDPSWMESQPVLATTYAVLTLERCLRSGS